MGLEDPRVGIFRGVKGPGPSSVPFLYLGLYLGRSPKWIVWVWTSKVPWITKTPMGVVSVFGWFPYNGGTTQNTHPKIDDFLVGKLMGLLGKPTILGTLPIYIYLHFYHKQSTDIKFIEQKTSERNQKIRLEQQNHTIVSRFFFEQVGSFVVVGFFCDGSVHPKAKIQDRRWHVCVDFCPQL